MRAEQMTLDPKRLSSDGVAHPGRRVSSSQDSIVPRPERPLEPRIIKPKPLHRGPSHIRHAGNEEIGVEEREVVLPVIIARIKEPPDHTPESMGYPFLLAPIAEWARPREVVQMLRSVTVGLGRYPRQAIAGVIRSAGRWHDVLELELADRGVTVGEGIASPASVTEPDMRR